MNVKKYVSIGICAVCIVAAGVCGGSNESVRTGKRGSAEKLGTVEKVVDVLETFSPQLTAVSVIYEDSVEGLSYQKTSEPMETSEYKSATIIAESTQTKIYSDDGTSTNHNGWEKVTAYLTEEVCYYQIKGFSVYTVSTFSTNYRVTEHLFFEYQAELYLEEELTLIKFSKYILSHQNEMTMRYSTTEEWTKVQEKVTSSNLKGIEFGEWYDIKELMEYDYSYWSSLVGTNLGKAMLALQARKDNYKQNETLYRLETEEIFSYIDLEETKSPEIFFSYDDPEYGVVDENEIRISLENVNATTVGKLRKPKIATVKAEEIGEEE